MTPREQVGFFLLVLAALAMATAFILWCAGPSKRSSDDRPEGLSPLVDIEKYALGLGPAGRFWGVAVAALSQHAQDLEARIAKLEAAASPDESEE